MTSEGLRVTEEKRKSFLGNKADNKTGRWGKGYALEEKDGKFQKFVQAFVYILKITMSSLYHLEHNFADEERVQTWNNTCFAFTTSHGK